MCGIAGIFARHCDHALDVEAISRKMVNTIGYRGPDAEGVWVDRSCRFAMAHRRLSILELSAAGSQPMLSESGRYVIVFNGEIYNHLELRSQLNCANWRGSSDTETLLVAVEKWGVPKTLDRLVGMFAFAIWDQNKKELSIARDRLGEKPLYYGWVGNEFVFASELKALYQLPNWRGSIDRNALSNFLQLSYIPAPQSIFQGIKKLIQGTFIVVTSKSKSHQELIPRTYWSAVGTVKKMPNKMSDLEVVEELEHLLKKSVTRQLLSDVPVGAFLSGGIDSSSIVSLMQAQTNTPVKTFSIGFSERDYNEAKYAKRVASHLNTEHTELYLDANDVLSVIPKLPTIYDEPFGDSSSVPTYLVAKLAREHVKVVLSGDGGDELFGGYNRYFLGEKLWKNISLIPTGFRESFGRALTSVSPKTWDSLISPTSRFLPSHLRFGVIGDKIHKLARLMDARTADEFYLKLISQHNRESSLVIGSADTRCWADNQMEFFESKDFVERMMFHDLLAYLPDDILTKVDRAAMSVSLETRVPFLDHELVEFALEIGRSKKIRSGRGKWLLKQVLYKYVPKSFFERPKQGFSFPLDCWLRGPLREWAETLLDEKLLRDQNFLNISLVREKWSEHLSGKRNWQHWIWNVLMWQAWLAEPSNKYERH